jgi:hypothetical protein
MGQKMAIVRQTWDLVVPVYQVSLEKQPDCRREEYVHGHPRTSGEESFE